MNFDLVVINGTVCSSRDTRRADVGVTGGRITAVSAPGSLEAGIHAGTRVIDASGKLVMPGFIDPHVHIHLPFMGAFAIDDHDSASRAALAGGTTTFIEMICPAPDQEPLSAFQEWSSKARNSLCDYSFHLGVVRFDDTAKQQITQIVREHAITSLKVFLAYKGALDVSDDTLYRVMSLARELGCVVTAHCENADAIWHTQQRLLHEGHTGPEWHEPSRPPFVEAEGVTRLTTFAQLTGAECYIVHTSCADAVRAVAEARSRRVNVHVEVVVPHLAFDKSFAARPDFEGAKYVMSPPLREQSHVDFLWKAIRGGTIDTIATDHAPFNFLKQKEMGRGDFTKIPNGIPSIQERVLFMHTLGVAKGLITIPQLVDLCSTKAAKIFGMHPRKGAIEVGSDADIVVFDPTSRGVFTRETSFSKTDYCAFEGMERIGAVTHTIRRGAVMYTDGRIVAPPASGVLVSRTPNT